MEVAKAKLIHLWPVAAKLVALTFFSWAASAFVSFLIAPQIQDLGSLLWLAKWLFLALPFMILVVFIWNIGRSPNRITITDDGLGIEWFDNSMTAVLWSDVQTARRIGHGHWQLVTNIDTVTTIWPGAFSNNAKTQLDRVISSSVPVQQSA
jgi:hypothetical protein